MNIHELFLVDRIRGTDGGGASSGAKGPTKGPAFEQILDQLRQLSEPAKTAEPAGADGKPAGAPAQPNTDEPLSQFSDAMRRADRDFVAMMDLRRQLEEAYRSRTS